VLTQNNIDMILIHYGAKKFDRDLFKPIQNEWIKPKGGLWTSPVDSEFGWKDWCRDNEFAHCNEKNSFKIELFPDAKIFVINTYKYLERAPLFTLSPSVPNLRYLDFEKLCIEYDAIYLTASGQWATRLTYPLNLNGWDCESVLIMNPDCFKEIIPDLQS
jgi:hypothetical protein